MPSIFEEARAKKASLEPPEPEQDLSQLKVTLTAKDLRDLPPTLVKGDFAKAISPRVEDGPKDVVTEAVERKESLVKGYKPARDVVIAEEDQVRALKEMDPNLKKSIIEQAKQLKKQRQRPVQLGYEETREGVNFLDQIKKGFSAQDSYIKPLATALSIDEHVQVKGLSDTLGLKKKDDISDYTWTNFYREQLYRPSVFTNNYKKSDFFKADPKKDLIDTNQWTGWEPVISNDDVMLEAAGIASSILLSPITYLTGGASAVQKIGLKLTASKKGVNLINKVSEKIADDRIILEMAKTKAEVPQQVQNLIRREAKLDAEQMVLRQFGEINSYNRSLDIDPRLSELKKADVLTKGGIGFEGFGMEARIAPITPKVKELYNAAKIKVLGQDVMQGEEVIKIVKDSQMASIPEILSQMDELTPVLNNKYKPPGMIKKGLDKISETGSKISNGFGKLFIQYNGIDKKMINYFRRQGPKAVRFLEDPGIPLKERSSREAAYMIANFEQLEAQHRKLVDDSMRQGKEMFKDLDEAQQSEFMDVLIKKGVQSEGKYKETVKALRKAGAKGEQLEEARSEAFDKLKSQEIKAPSGDIKVQEKIDQWLGQGKYKGKGISDQLGDRLNLFESDKLPVWVPGIVVDKAGKIEFRLPTDKAQREFLTPRKGGPQGYGYYSDQYTRNAALAVGHRLAEIGRAELQEKFFNNMVQMKLGDLRPGTAFRNDFEAIKDGYAPVRRPAFKQVDSGVTVLEAFDKSEKFYVKKEIAEVYNRHIRSSQVSVPGLTWFTGVWKRHVYSLWPASHLRNMTSAVIQNASSIGLHSINPASHAVISQALRHGDKAKGEIVTEIGERIRLSDLVREASEQGAIDSGQYVADMMGDTLPEALQKSWKNTLTRYANPLSKDFSPAVLGSKFGRGVENQMRLVNYTHWRMKGISPELAALESNNALFDYRAVTSFEKSLSSTWIPFYIFPRKNIEASVKLLAMKPGFLANHTRLYREVAPSEEEMEGMPDWARNKFIAKWRDNFYTGFGLPIESAIEIAMISGDPVDGLMKQLNPLVRFTGEKWVTERDAFSKRDIERVNNAQEFKFLVDLVEDPSTPKPVWRSAAMMAYWLGLERDSTKPEKIIGDANKLHIMRNMFTSRYQSYLGMMQKEDQTMAKLILRGLGGIVTIDNNPELASSIEAQRTAEAMYKKTIKTNFSKPATIRAWIKGDTDEGERRAEIANEYFEKLHEMQQDGAPRVQIIELKEEYDKLLEEDLENRTTH